VIGKAAVIASAETPHSRTALLVICMGVLQSGWPQIRWDARKYPLRCKKVILQASKTEDLPSLLQFCNYRFQKP
jgi:hypothetical protein